MGLIYYSWFVGDLAFWSVTQFNRVCYENRKVHSYSISVCSTVETINIKCCGRSEELLHEVECNNVSGRPQHRRVTLYGNAVADAVLLQTDWPLGSWLSRMFIVILLLSHLVSGDRCGTWLYRFPILAVFLTFIANRKFRLYDLLKFSLKMYHVLT